MERGALGTRFKEKTISLLVAFVLAVTGLCVMPFAAYAEAGDLPDHSKTLTVNNDGTYTLALNVKGDSEKQVQKVNVIVIVDKSYSMSGDTGTGAYVASNTNGPNMYGYVDGEYVLLTRQGNRPGNYTYWYNGTQYTGQRYQYDASSTRLEATKQAVNGLAYTLLGYNGKDGNPSDTVQMALVTFGGSASTDVSSTTSYDTYSTAVNGIAIQNGTNWEEALKAANNVSFGDTDPTYLIFFTDGAPTYSSTRSGIEQEPNMQNCYNDAVDDAQALATKVGVNNFYTIFAYGEDFGATYLTSLTAAAGAPSTNNFSASNTAQLNDAFATILESIEMAGIGAVSINDGTTSSVTTTTGQISHLLTVDENSYKYYRAGGTAEGGSGEKYDSTANDGLGVEWTDAPAATFEEGSVKWDLSSEGVLENDVTYTVTFDCWPSQTTLDIVADIKNDPSSYDSLDANIKKYINADGSLKTNTSASLSYTDTRTGQTGSAEYDNPEPVETTAVEQLAVSKEWDNDLDSKSAEPITLNVTRDGDTHHTMTLSKENDWTSSTYVSIGILRHADDGAYTDSNGNKFEVLETGHDFTFTEPAELGYYWELKVPTVRPMVVDNTLTMLILKNDAYTNPDGALEYTIDGDTYYVGSTGAANLTATNQRRARLNLTKVVNGEDADPNQAFPFTLNVVDSKASEGSASDLNSDYYVWFSVYNGGYVDALVSGADKEIKDGAWTGYYYAPSGTNIVVNLKAGDNLRFLNLPTDSTYTFTEGTLPDNYAFVSSELTSGTDPSFAGAQITKGTIEVTNIDYTVTYTNQYALTDIEITKVWKDEGNQDGIRPSAENFKSLLTLKADGTDVTDANADKLTVEVDSEDNNKYIIKWTGLDRYADGEEIAYTVEETNITGYTTTGSPAEDHGTITNTHTPETTTATVNKIWADDENKDGKRPTELKVELYAGAEKVLEKVLTAAENWTLTVSNLAVYKNGTEIVYSWKEALGALAGVYELTKTDIVAATNTYTFTNAHTSINTSAEATAIPKKTVSATGTAWASKTFSFKIEAGTATYDDNTEGVSPLGVNSTGEVTTATATFNQTGTQPIDFGLISFTKAGTYRYTVTETTESGSGWVCDAVAHNVVVTVKKSEDGILAAEVTTPAEITNTYSASGSATLEVAKALGAGDTWPSGKKAAFTLAAVTEGAPMPEETSVELTEAGTAKFGKITYNESIFEQESTASKKAAPILNLFKPNTAYAAEQLTAGEVEGLGSARSKTFVYTISETSTGFGSG